VVSDFNAGKLNSLPNFYQHVTCGYRGEEKLKITLITDTEIQSHVFAKSDHNSILLTPANKQKLK
jgi:hypothetical protein